jgi:hydroxyethylthiazole kinase
MDAYAVLEQVRERKPLVHHITNWVTIYDCANITRVFGALPVMAHAHEEVEQMVGLAGSLVLNIGTLTPELVESMILAARAANKKGIPVVLDAVGVGATDLRTQSALNILDETRVDVLKGNYGEVGVLAGAEAEVKGVESVSLEGDPLELARSLSKELDNTVAMTGKRDIVCGKKTYLIDNGTDMMGSIVGTGCMAASVIGCFTAVDEDYANASAAALTCFGVAGELASKKARGPGSYKRLFYDAAYSLKGEVVEARMKVTEK